MQPGVRTRASHTPRTLSAHSAGSILAYPKAACIATPFPPLSRDADGAP